ncbi:MAG: glycosyltransferase family 4 protein [Rhodocyclaceae bacterium]|nr:glycosyltransferase family 4 protein [Rhodocyclaceae bacterium]
MRIVHTESSCGWGGQEIRILEEAQGLSERGHDVRILCPRQSCIYEEGSKRGAPVYAVPIARKNLQGLLALRTWMVSHRPDVVNVHSSTDAWLVALAAQTLRAAPPIVRTRHISAAVPDNAATRWLYNKAMQHVVTTGEAIRRQLIAATGIDPARVTSVPTGIDPQRFAPADYEQRIALRQRLGLDPDGVYIGILATLRSWKGHLDLLEAFALARQTGWRLLLIGDGPMRGPISQRIAELGLCAHARLVGQQERPEEWLRVLDVFALPSYANEGVPQALVQAMLTALPIVTTPVGAIPEAVSQDVTGLLVPPRSPRSLADALRQLVMDKDRAVRLGTMARVEALEKFSKAAMLDRMETIFRTAMSTQSV